MKNHEEDAHQALQEAIDNGGKMTMRIPADESKDTDLRIARALKELRDLSTTLDRVKATLDGSAYQVRPPSTVRVNEALNIIKNYEEDNK